MSSLTATKEWSLTIADQRVHGTTHQRPAERFAEERLTPLGARAAYRYEQRRQRRVPADALVAIAAGRYSVPAQYVGTTVSTRHLAWGERGAGQPQEIALPERRRFLPHSVTLKRHVRLQSEEFIWQHRQLSP